MFDRVTHGYAVSADGVKIHYASLARRLDAASFFQVSRNAIIRLDAVKEAKPFSDGTGEILLANGQTMIVARRRWRALLEKLEA